MNLNQVTDSTRLELIPVNAADLESFAAFFMENKKDIDEKLLQSGAVKFQGVKMDSIDTFQEIVNSISTKFLDYIDGNSPRTKLAGQVYTSTEYDQTQKITMHNELSYSAKWPGKLFFCCIQPSETGGETLLADSRAILERMNPTIVSEIKNKGIRYIRNLHGGQGMGPSWQSTFETDDKALVEKYCGAKDTQFEWRENDSLRLTQFSKGIVEHRITKEKVWFNQVDQFHPSHLGEELYEIIQSIYDKPEYFPMYVEYGDGGPIEESAIKEITKTIEEVTIAPVWNRNELLIVDNELMSHGRNPFTGERQVLVAMCE